MAIDALSGAGAGIQTIQNAQKRLDEAATVIAETSAQSENTAVNGQQQNVSGQTQLTQALIELDQARLQADAGAKIVETENRTVGAILDIRV
jgi:uncharacterized protein YbaP (TraB family)